MGAQRLGEGSLSEAQAAPGRSWPRGKSSRARQVIEEALERAGVDVGGPRPWDIAVHDERFYDRVLRRGSLGMGESYVEGQWDCPRLDELVAHLLRGAADEALFDWRRALLRARDWLLNAQTVARAGEVARAHYDLGNDLFEAMLGPTLCYSCGYWREASDLDAAQTAKMDLICRKLALGPGQRLLDLGCGWGSLLRHAADHYGCEGVGITVSAAQREHAAARIEGRKLRFELLDYRSEELRRLGPFDKIASVGMFEHVGPRNDRTFLRVARRLLRDDGLFLLHTIGNDRAGTDPWIEKYIFPNAALPSLAGLSARLPGLFVMEDWHNFRADYARTLRAWHERFEYHAAKEGLPERMRRTWRYYLLGSAGSFEAGNRNQLWQIVLSKRGVEGGYRSLR